MDAIIKEHVTTSQHFTIEDLRERPVGFDLETESIIVFVTGLIQRKNN